MPLRQLQHFPTPHLLRMRLRQLPPLVVYFLRRPKQPPLPSPRVRTRSIGVQTDIQIGPRSTVILVDRSLLPPAYFNMLFQGFCPFRPMTALHLRNIHHHHHLSPHLLYHISLISRSLASRALAPLSLHRLAVGALPVRLLNVHAPLLLSSHLLTPTLLLVLVRKPLLLLHRLHLPTVLEAMVADHLHLEFIPYLS